jgi:hypothetical protein
MSITTPESGMAPLPHGRPPQNGRAAVAPARLGRPLEVRTVIEGSAGLSKLWGSREIPRNDLDPWPIERPTWPRLPIQTTNPSRHTGISLGEGAEGIRTTCMHRDQIRSPRKRGRHMGRITTAGEAIRHLHELNEALKNAGYLSKIIQPMSGHPFVKATNPHAYQMSEQINCQENPSSEGILWFFWSWGDPICPAVEITSAVSRVGNVIGERL